MSDSRLTHAEQHVPDEMTRISLPRLSRRGVLVAGLAGGALAISGSRRGHSAAATSSSARALSRAHAKTGGSLTVCVDDRWTNAGDATVVAFDPLPSGNAASIWARTQVFDRLTRLAADGRTIEPGLAEGWEIGPDGMTYTFRLREAQFQDGLPVTAADVVYSLHRMAETIPLLPPHVWEATDARTAVARPEAPWSPFAAALAHWICSIVPQRLVEEQGLAFFEQPVGSGPFALDSWDDAWEHGTRIVLKRNPSFREAGRPYLDELVLVNVLDPSASATMLQSGELDAVDSLPWDALATLQADPGVTLLNSATAIVRFCNINTSRPPFDDVSLRKAMNHAVDKQALIAAIAAGHGEPANTYLFKIAQHNDAAPGFPFDLTKARALAATSAGSDGFDAELLVRASRPIEVACSEVVRAQLAEIGGTVTVSAVDEDEYGARIASNRYDLSFDTWGPAYPDPELITRFSVYGKSGNAAHYANPEVDALYEASLTTTDPAEYAAIYREIQTLVNEDAPFLLLFHDGPSGVARRSVRDFRIPPAVGAPRLWEVWRDDA